MTVEDDIATFRRAPTLALLGIDALRIMAIGSEVQHVHKNDVLFSEGEPADSGFVVQTGSFALTAQHLGARETVVARPGALLGELALITETVRPVTATAREPSTVIRIPRSMFLRMLEGYPDAAEKLRAHLAARSLDTARSIDDLCRMLKADGGRGGIA